MTNSLINKKKNLYRVAQRAVVMYAKNSQKAFKVEQLVSAINMRHAMKSAMSVTTAIKSPIDLTIAIEFVIIYKLLIKFII